MTSTTEKYKIVMLGDFAVGKTSMVKRYVYDLFDELYLTTIGVKVSKKEMAMETPAGTRNVTLLLWDIGGLVDVRNLTTQYLQGASAAVVVADLTRLGTITQIEAHIREFLAVNPRGIVTIAFNKVDRFSESEFPGNRMVRETYGARYGAASFRTSAKPARREAVAHIGRKAREPRGVMHSIHEISALRHLSTGTAPNWTSPTKLLGYLGARGRRASPAPDSSGTVVEADIAAVQGASPMVSAFPVNRAPSVTSSSTSTCSLSPRRSKPRPCGARRHHGEDTLGRSSRGGTTSS